MSGVASSDSSSACWGERAELFLAGHEETDRPLGQAARFNGFSNSTARSSVLTRFRKQ